MEELNRQKKVIDMMVSMHSDLADMYKFRAQSINLTLIISAFILNILVFADYDFLSKNFGLSPEFLKFCRGIASAIIFLTSLVILVVRWREKSEAHKNAKNKLFALLSDCRKILEMESENSQKKAAKQFTDDYKLIVGNLTPISSKMFGKLKSKHYRKVEFSKYIDKHKKVPYLLQKLRFFRIGIGKNHEKSN